MLCATPSIIMDIYQYLLRTLKFTGLKYYYVTVNFNNRKLKFTIPLNYIDPVLSNFRHIFLDCDYFIHRELIPREGYRVLDIGASLGFYTMASSTLSGPRGVIVAVEPNPHILPYLYNNIEINKGNNIRVYTYAVCPDNGSRKLYVGKYVTVSSIIKEHVEFHTDINEAVDVQCTRLSSLIRFYGFVDILKLDVEGIELDVLRESRHVLNRVGTIVVEVHVDVIDENDIEKLLLEAGFNKILLYASSELPYQIVLFGIKERNKVANPLGACSAPCERWHNKCLISIV